MDEARVVLMNEHSFRTSEQNFRDAMAETAMREILRWQLKDDGYLRRLKDIADASFDIADAMAAERARRDAAARQRKGVA